MMKWFNKKKKDNKGFTLVELVIVVAILALLVGLLAPQYTKYVEKSRKSADAANMDEMVKAVQVYAADPENDLPEGDYVIKISESGADFTTDVTLPSDVTAEKIMSETIPDYKNAKLKSKKWTVASGSDIEVTATVKIDKNGGTTVVYSPADFAEYCQKSNTNPAPSTETPTSGE